MSEERLVPRKRLKKFNEAWIKKQFNDLGTFGKTYPFSRSKEGIGKYYHIHYGDIHTKNFGVIDENSVLPMLEVEDNFELVKHGDIVIADASEDYKDLGKSVVIGMNINKQIIAGLHTFKFTPNEHLCPLYYLYYSQTRIFKKFSYKTGTGISVFGMSKDNLGKMKLCIPSIGEQQKIGEFFKVLDDRIANQERKIAKVKALKAAYLTEMFPQEGETVPKRRFKGFEGEWEDKEIYEIADRYDNARIPITESQRISGNTPYYGANGIQDYVEGYTHDGENILLAEDGANDLKDYPVYYCKGQIWVNNHAHVLKGKSNLLNNLFLSYLLKSTDMTSYLVGGGRAKLNSDAMMSIVCRIPIYEEQQKIGKLFKNIDDQIEMEEKKLDKLQKMKEAYLEEMFV